MSSGRGLFGFVVGAVVGAAAGLVADILVAPRAGAETRDMVAQGANEAWDNVVDTYQRGAREVREKASEATADFGAKSDELREKVDQARARMDQIRSALSENMAEGASRVAEAVDHAAEGAARGFRYADASQMPASEAPTPEAPAEPAGETASGPEGTPGATA